MSFVPFCLNTLWMWSCRREWRAFQRATRDPAKAQSAVLLRIIRSNAETEFGRRHGFASISSVAEFRRRVPLAEYDSFAGDVDRITNGEQHVLTAEPVRLLEPTSGSTSGRKLIPYTDSLRREFQRMVAAWIYDLFRRRPAVRRGRAYWSISPAMSAGERTAGNIAIGFDDDTAYLGGIERMLMRRLLAVRPEVARLTDIEEFRYETILQLSGAADLSLISVWSPTFLTALLQRIDEWAGRLCDDLGNRRHRIPAARANHLRDVLESAQPLPQKLQQIWPDLALVSCWADAAAGTFLPELQRLLPHVEIQSKGLLATEGCVSFPLMGRTGAALALRSHFCEFEDLRGDSSCPLLAHELKPGGEYAVVLTTGGGLYRYRLGDIVRVVGFEGRCPLLTFQGRSGTVSDLAGEKLAEPFVRACLNTVFDELNMTPRFALVVPVVSSSSRHYRLYLQLEPNESRQEEPEFFALRLQHQLEQNPHYRYASQLGQLEPIEVRLLDLYGESGWSLYEARNLQEGKRAGDIKPVALDTRTGWESVFEGFAISRASGALSYLDG